MLLRHDAPISNRQSFQHSRFIDLSANTDSGFALDGLRSVRLTIGNKVVNVLEQTRTTLINGSNKYAFRDHSLFVQGFDGSIPMCDIIAALRENDQKAHQAEMARQAFIMLKGISSYRSRL